MSVYGGDDLDGGGELSVAAAVIGVMVGAEDVLDGLVGDAFDQRVDLVIIGFIFVVDHDDAVAGDIDGDVSAVALDLIEIGLDVGELQWGRLLSVILRECCLRWRRTSAGHEHGRGGKADQKSAIHAVSFEARLVNQYNRVRSQKDAMGKFLDMFAGSRGDAGEIRRIHALRAEYSRLSDEALRAIAPTIAAPIKDLLPMVAVTAVIASRVLGQDMFDVQLGARWRWLAEKSRRCRRARGRRWRPCRRRRGTRGQGAGVHVMTVNDYLARRDAAWMGEIYRRLGLSVGYLQQGMSTAERQPAYACDVMYATANEIGFDFLRDRLALHLEEQVQRPFAAAVIDEADSILIDEARIPLVIAGGDAGESGSGAWRGPAGSHAAAAGALDGGRRQQQRGAYGCGDQSGGRRLPLRQSLRGAQSQFC